jgi:microsomal dipeptidase-like Zn-dependent dipeptidase
MKTIIADLHCHSTFFPVNQMKRSIWHQHHHLVFPSQGDFVKLAKGGVRVLFLTLYPVEQGFLKCNLLGLGTGNIADRMAHFVLNMPKARADEVQDYDHSYYNDLLCEYDLLLNSPESKKVRLNLFRRKEFKFRIVRDFEDLKNILNLDESFNYRSVADDTIAVIPTIEGAHSLGAGQYNTLTLGYSNLHEGIKKNIEKLKKLGPDGQEGLFCPFSVSLCHFYWNQLGGHSVSLWKLLREVFDQRPGINKGIEKLGRFVVDELLSKSNGKRILIDVAHMSVKVREWFYYKYLPDRKSETGETIPIIVSHTGVNGWKDFMESEILGSPDLVHDYADNRYENSKIFNPWDVFLCDEEILIIHDSGGLIGLSLDERIMMGKKTLDTVKKETKYINHSYLGREIWIEPLIEEIIHIAETIYNREKKEERAFDENIIWDNICIGSDYDGMITPIKAYPNASYFPKLDKMLFEGLKKRKGYVEFLLGKTDFEIREITDKIIWKNALQFLKKHFN